MKSEIEQAVKLFLILCIIFLVGTLLGTMVYLAKNRLAKISQPQVSVTPASTSSQISGNVVDWKTYSGQGISFQYPNNLMEQSYKTYRGGLPEQHFTDNQSKEVLWFRIQDNVNPSNGQQPYANIDDLCPKDLKNQQCLFKKIVIDNVPVLYSGNGTLFLSPDKSKFYNLQFDGPNVVENQTIIKQILSTFKFIEKDETTEWKTYTNEKYGFEFKYPEDFYLEEPAIIGSGLEYPDIRSFYSLDLHSTIPEGEGPQWNSVFILITVHQNGFELLPLGMDLTNAKEGEGIEEALQRAYAGKTGLVTYKKIDNHEEYGRIERGSLFYYTLLSSEKYNYSVGIHLPYSVRKDSTDGEMQKFINNYNRILSTFKFIKTDKTTEDNFSNKDSLLHKLFPNLSFKNGAADLTRDVYSGLKLYLKDSIEDYFINNQEKSLLLVAQLDGVPHAGGLYHAYLGLFDKNGNLLTPSSVFSKSDDFFNDKAQFGGDEGNF